MNAQSPRDDADLPLHDPDTFGEASVRDGAGMTVLAVLDAAPAPRAGARPGVQRLLQGDGANVIAFTFTPGQALPDHRAAHPITVQGLSGVLDFTCGDRTVRLLPGVVVHLPGHVTHRVDCPADAPSTNVLLLTMLTGERHG